MSTETGRNQTSSPEEIRDDLERTREQLGDTAEALAAKADVKARAQEKVADVKQKVSSASPQSANGAASQLQATVRANPIPSAAIGAFVGGYLLGRLAGRD
jgi:ElaB/YqjD/DUF883 family membrane-anchored ribosome-binding protein